MTMIDYPDLIRTSPSENLRLEVRSPDNSPNPPADPKNSCRDFWGGFQSDFDYSVRSTESGALLWQRCHDCGDAITGPCAAWVSDEGEAVVITRTTFTSELILFDSRGNISLRCDVGTELFENSDGEFCWTSAGPHWNERGVGIFIESGSSRWWCFRTQFGRQIGIDLNHPALRGIESVATPLREAQSEWALSTLRGAVNDRRLFGDEGISRAGVHSEVDLVWSAIQWSGIDGLTASLPLLEKLEHSTFWNGCGFGWPAAGAGSTILVHLKLVPIAQLSMRRLGREPAGLSGYWLCESDWPDTGRRLKVPERIENRSERLLLLREGMTRHDVVEIVGMPDIDSTTWDYDELQSESGPRTTSLRWDTLRGPLTRIERVPAAWQVPYSRSHWL